MELHTTRRVMLSNPKGRHESRSVNNLKLEFENVERVLNSCAPQRSPGCPRGALISSSLKLPKGSQGLPPRVPMTPHDQRVMANPWFEYAMLYIIFTLINLCLLCCVMLNYVFSCMHAYMHALLSGCLSVCLYTKTSM